jgi:hypothetical protein
MAAEIGEEVGGKRDRLVAEDALCRDEERRLGLVCRLLLLARRLADGELGHLQRLAVDLAEDSRGSASTISKWLGIM